MNFPADCSRTAAGRALHHCTIRFCFAHTWPCSRAGVSQPGPRPLSHARIGRWAIAPGPLAGLDQGGFAPLPPPTPSQTPSATSCTSGSFNRIFQNAVGDERRRSGQSRRSGRRRVGARECGEMRSSGRAMPLTAGVPACERLSERPACAWGSVSVSGRGGQEHRATKHRRGRRNS